MAVPMAAPIIPAAKAPSRDPAQARFCGRIAHSAMIAKIEAMFLTVKKTSYFSQRILTVVSFALSAKSANSDFSGLGWAVGLNAVCIKKAPCDVRFYCEVDILRSDA